MKDSSTMFATTIVVGVLMSVAYFHGRHVGYNAGHDDGATAGYESGYTAAGMPWATASSTGQSVDRLPTLLELDVPGQRVMTQEQVDADIARAFRALIRQNHEAWMQSEPAPFPWEE